MNQAIDIERIQKDMAFINSINADPQGVGCNRFSYSKEDQQVRDYLEKEFERLNLTTKVDSVGNILASYNPNNSDEQPVWVGSHIDTVPNGGRFDGLTGTIVALETIRAIQENQIEINRPVELIIFAEEEGSNFGTTTLGSKVMTGKVDQDELKNLTNDEGKSAYEVMEDFNLDVENAGKEVLQKEDVYAMIEMHIEQGGVLEKENKTIGINHTIAGMNSFSIQLKGLSNHAGTTPMAGRKDPLVGASQVILDLEKYAREEANDTAVATVGKLDCLPNGTNVINSEVTFHVDIRDIEQESIDEVSKALYNMVDRIAEENGLDYSIDKVGASSPAKLSPKLVDLFEEKAKENDLSYRKMHSGAVHDCMMLSDLTDVMLVFVPSKDGISHNPNEYTSLEDIKQGAGLVYEGVVALAQE